MGTLIKRSGTVIRSAILSFIVSLALAGCGNTTTTGSNTKVAPSIFDAPLGSNAALLNGTGVNPTVPSATAPVAGGCLSRLSDVNGNDINCSNDAKYASMGACDLNPYFGYANFLVTSCPTSNLIGTCTFTTHKMHYYQGYLIISPSTPVSALSAGCVTDHGTWG